MRPILAFVLFSFSLPLFADITVSTITPAAGLIAGGTIVHIHGTNLLGAPLACPALQCSVYVQFGDTLGTVIYDSAGEIVVVAPAHTAGSVDLVVNVPLSPPVTLKNAFVYQDPSSDTVRVLLPIAAGTQGILNTTWQTDVLAHNETASPVVIAGTTIPPVSTKSLTLSPASTGMFLQIPRSVADKVTITTHVHDTTHDFETLGVDVPTVPETQFRRAVVLNGVPRDVRYRVLLRVYGYPGSYSAIVRVRDDGEDRFLSSQTLTLSGSDVAYLQLPIATGGANSIRVEVTTGQSTDPPIWAFLTLTNNTTESVTIITPNAVTAPEAGAAVLTAGHWGHAGACMNVSIPSPVCPTDCSNLVSATAECGWGWFTLPVVDPDGHFEADGEILGGGAFPKAASTGHFSGFVTRGGTAALLSPGFEHPATLIYGSTDGCGTIACP